MSRTTDFRKGLPVFWADEVIPIGRRMAHLLYGMSLAGAGILALYGALVAMVLPVSLFPTFWVVPVAAVYFLLNAGVFLYRHIVRLGQAEC